VLDMNNDFDEQKSIHDDEAKPEFPNSSEYIEVKPKKKYNFITYISLVLVTALISSSVVGGVLYSKFSSEIKNQNTLIQKAGITTASLRATDVNKTNKDNIVKTALVQGSSIAEIAKKVGPSIIGIRMTVGNPQSRSYGTNQASAQVEGSGIIISQDGYIMTNYHVVQYADPKGNSSSNTTLEVFLPDKRQAKAKFIGGDSKNDLAVIKIDLKNLPVAELGDSSKLAVGDQAIAIGNPLGMEFAGSVTVGVISALNRQVDAVNTSMNLIQTDAAINPGNSGGALVNSQGQVIGINSIKISQTGVEGLGFAIPINDVKPIVDQLIMFGYIKGRLSIGITGQQITDIIARQYGLQIGIYVMDVTKGSGADIAGIQKDDILINLDGKEIKTIQDLDNVMKGHKVSDTVSVTIVRQGVKKVLQLTFSEDK